MIARTSRLSALVVLASLIFLLAAPGLAVLAHANLVRSNPPAGSILTQAPDDMIMEFNEQLDPSLTRAILLDTNSQVLSDGPGEIDPDNPKILVLPLPPLDPGTYTVKWLARSQVDGHNTTGTVGFSVGNSSPPASLLLPAGTPDPATELPNPFDTLFRWLGFLLLAVTAGSVFFSLLIWRAAYTSAEIGPDQWLTWRIKRLVIVGALGLIFASAGLILVQAIQLGPADVGKVLYQILIGRTGIILAARTLFLFAILFLFWHIPLAAHGNSLHWIVAAFLIMGVLLTFSLQSHAAASGSWLEIGSDVLHLTSMTIWLGGLLPLVWLVLHYRNAPESSILPPVIRRFSWTALVCVILLAGTGFYSAYQRVGTYQALVSTAYGRVMIVKLSVFALLLVIGALNLLYFTPRLRRDAASAVRWLSRSTRLELALGIIVLLCVGVLTGAAPALEALAAQNRLGILQAEKVGDNKVVLRIAPGVVGENEFGVDVYERHPPPDLPLTVLLRFKLLGASLGTTQAEAQHQTGRRYTTRGSYISLVGTWQIEVILRREGFNDQRLRFIVEMGDEPLSQPASPATQASQTNLSPR
jgi:copper transport protein